MQKPPFTKDLLHPKHWPVWLLIGVFAAITHLPYRWQLKLGKGVGLLAHKLLNSRRHVTEVNIKLCFPELSEEEQQRLVRESFINVATGFFETMIGWFRPGSYLLPMATFKGFEKIDEAKATGKGVILLGAHYSILDLAGALFCQETDVIITYKRQPHPVLNYVMESCRAGIYKHMFTSKEIRKAITALQQGESVWYAPDQDLGTKYSVFADFFGVSTSTLTTTSFLAEEGNAVVLPVSYFRHEDNSGYYIEVFDALPVPSGDWEEDTKIINQFIENQIRRHPSQYLWLHKRFKTQPNKPRGELYKNKG